MTSQPQSSPAPPAPRRHARRRWTLWVAAISAVGLLILLGPGQLARMARLRARRAIEAGAISEAGPWLEWVRWWEPSDGEIDLLAAAGYRQLGQMERWSAAIESAREKSAPAQALDREFQLASIQAGKTFDDVNAQLVALIDSGVSPREAAAAFVQGFLASNRTEEAQKLLDAWQADQPESPHVAFWRGACWHKLNQRERALEQYRLALAREPRHELSALAIAELLEEQDQLEEALAEYEALAQRLPSADYLAIRLARTLRQLGRLDEADRLLQLQAPIEPCPAEWALELGQIQLAAGRYPAAAKWLAEAAAARPGDQAALALTATAFRLAGDDDQADRWFGRRNAARARSTRLYELQARLAFEPDDYAAAEALRQLAVDPSWNAADVAFPADGQPGSAEQLYARHCEACHGAEGDGQGIAAQHVFPRPRAFRSEPFRLVSTLRGLPTQQDLQDVIRRGMPGTSMPAFPDLTDEQRRLLADLVWQQYRAGLAQQLVDQLRDDGETIGEAELAQWLDQRTDPGSPAPAFHRNDGESSQGKEEQIARGREIYLRQTCHSCHGEDGMGSGDQPLFDDQQRPTSPRDLVRDPFKGGADPSALYLRILLGMPGTPHPGSPSLAKQDLDDLIEFCLSLSREPKRTLTNHQRERLATRHGRPEP